MFQTIDFSDIFSSDYSNKISFKKGEIIHSYRDYEEKTPQIGAILEGTAVLEGPTNEGRWMINALIGQHSLFGMESLLETKTAPELTEYRVRALENGTVLFIDREFLLNYLYANPQFFHLILDEVIVRYLFTSKNYKNINQAPIVKVTRILVEIIELLHLHQTEGAIELPVYVTQTFLADYCRSSRARVTEVLEELRESGLLLSKKPITISSHENLLNQIDSFQTGNGLLTR
ncbi:TPA: Crp/Fnr family transcriptional regulator [Listeria monocytogenes]|uniref:Crp/Fnr family transcriptional regulator n=1 Tax=Listeria monocytogenes TaxID=1639 RepID=UPI00085C0A10|nr:Crp/Fnr family transcriptional regulator [Listeria monocytogenes]EAF4602803.1 Crp/Fnr family transcriptional regulator [Listeria monocytogenes serotype 1/2a]EAH4406276.1 Crp/Fnr family transcriptional regulator [Listeria monocytogenes serotype 1/2b]EAC2314549.1 Crp/Fnr family transcriptional regulator [Listeria monocytogenes]EAC4745676.1 Crp/Fnr family transcriptional regulator [Listeria monocytogenes]EAD1591997.1 Crp/Fnr family transcriptional regulator [Listeria monocytogenes]